MNPLLQDDPVAVALEEASQARKRKKISDVFRRELLEAGFSPEEVDGMAVEDDDAPDDDDDDDGFAAKLKVGKIPAKMSAAELRSRCQAQNQQRAAATSDAAFSMDRPAPASPQRVGEILAEYCGGRFAPRPAAIDAAFARDAVLEERQRQTAAARNQQISEARGQAVTEELVSGPALQGAAARPKFDRQKRRDKIKRLIREIQFSKDGTHDGKQFVIQEGPLATEVQRRGRREGSDLKGGMSETEWLQLVSELWEECGGTRPGNSIAQQPAYIEASLSMTEPGQAVAPARSDHIARQLVPDPINPPAVRRRR
jgi:hypothetical protein